MVCVCEPLGPCEQGWLVHKISEWKIFFISSYVILKVFLRSAFWVFISFEQKQSKLADILFWVPHGQLSAEVAFHFWISSSWFFLSRQTHNLAFAELWSFITQSACTKYTQYARLLQFCSGPKKKLITPLGVGHALCLQQQFWSQTQSCTWKPPAQVWMFHCWFHLLEISARQQNDQQQLQHLDICFEGW